MPFKSIFSIFIAVLSVGVFSTSCDVETENTNESLNWTHNLFTSQETKSTSDYYSVYNADGLKIVGQINATDSVVIRMGVVGTNELKVGSYLLKKNGFYTIQLHKNGNTTKALSGNIHLFRVQNRVDFDFEANLEDGTRLEFGEARNLLLNTEDPKDSSKPTTQEGTIVADINGQTQAWNKNETYGQFAPAFEYLGLGGNSVAHSIAFSANGYTSKAEIIQDLNTTLDLNQITLNYTINSTNQTYTLTFGTAKFLAFNDQNELTISIENGILDNVSAPNPAGLTIDNCLFNKVQVQF
ncbi:MAG: hypothetical protein ACPGEC_04335 [Flavobacteriales bacterium]